MAAETYVISIYRRGGAPGKEVAGLIERAGAGERKAFASSQELWALICGTPHSAAVRQPRKPPVRGEP